MPSNEQIAKALRAAANGLIDACTLIQSLQSDVCPICRGFKKPAQTMCAADYRRLPVELRTRLYDRVGEGYEEAVDAAMKHLGATTFYLIPKTMRKGS